MKDTLLPGIVYEHRFELPASKMVPALYPEADEFVAAGFQMFYQGDDCLRRALTVEDVGAVEDAAVGDAFQVAEVGVGFRFGEAGFDAGLVSGTSF